MMKTLHKDGLIKLFNYNKYDNFDMNVETEVSQNK